MVQVSDGEAGSDDDERTGSADAHAHERVNGMISLKRAETMAKLVLRRDNSAVMVKGMRRGQWEEVRDPTVGTVYYFNHDTQESQWDVPLEFQSPTSKSYHTLPVQTTASPPDVVNTPVVDTSGRRGVSFVAAAFNGGEDTPRADAAATDDGVAGDSAAVAAALYTVGCWQAFLDAESQCCYFYNVETGVSEWEPPEEVAAYLHTMGSQYATQLTDLSEPAAVIEPYDPTQDPNYIGTAVQLPCGHVTSAEFP